MPDTGLSIQHLSKDYMVDNAAVHVLDDISLDIKEGEFISVVGHSGCGKSTMLRIIAGLEGYDEGTLTLGGRRLEEPGLDRGMIFQDHRLFPWMTVWENIEFGLYDVKGKAKDDLIREHIVLVGLEGFESAYPRQLSGGMAQRAAIARALVHRPKVLLLDEPFGALDALTRIQLQQEVLNIWRKEKTTMILVTHDIDEAIYLGDRVIVMSNRPAKIQKVLKVELSRPRDRTSDDFSHLRRQIYTEFFGKVQELIDYMI
ncbi:MAG: ABC transporter ATP-binding protein [Ethanoligenens sp.]